jgi:hypothetical protein
MLGIRSCGVLSSYMWCTKWIFVCPCSYSGSVEMLNSLNPPSALQYLGLSVGTSSLLVARLLEEPLPASETFIVKGISSVVEIN